MCAESAKEITITPLAWNMPVNDAATALDSNHFTTELILESKEFSICIPDMEMLDTVIKCGSGSGRGKDKFAEFKLEYEKCSKINKFN